MKNFSWASVVRQVFSSQGSYSVSRTLVLCFIVICTSSVSVLAQPSLWGITQKGGDGGGVIFRTHTDGTAQQVVYKFPLTPSGNNLQGGLVEYNGKFYGLTNTGGTADHGTLYEYNPADNSIITRVHFISSVNGRNPMDALVVYGTKLYGTTQYGGTSDMGTLFEYDPATNTLTTKINFSGTNGSLPFGSLTVHNSLLYGVTQGGATPGSCIIYDYDPASVVLTKRAEFTLAIGSQPRGGMVVLNDKLYGCSSYGGASMYGTIFEFNPVGSVLSNKFSFDYVTYGLAPNGGLVTDGMLIYGTTTNGSGGAGIGSIFSFNPSTSAMTNVFTFRSTSGNAVKGYAPNSGLIISGSKLYGTTYQGGDNSKGVLYEYDLGTSTYTKKTDFTESFMMAVSLPNSLLLSGGILYGVGGSTSGIYHSGVLYKVNPSTSVYTKLTDFNAAPAGSKPAVPLIVQGSKMYGITATGGINDKGAFFEFDPATSVYTKKADIDGSSINFVYSDLVLVGNNIYGVSSSSGTNGRGSMFEYNTSTGVLAKKADLNSASIYSPMAICVYGSKIYGVTSQGGATTGAVFEFDPATSALNKTADFTAALGYPTSSMAQYNGKLYGFTTSGGANNYGVFYEYDPAPAANTLIKKFDLSASTGGMGYGMPVIYGDRLYTLMNNGGANGFGTIVEYNFTTSTFTKKVDFDNANLGQYPYGSLIESNGKLYGMTQQGGTYGLGTLFEFDPANGSITKLLDFNGQNGGLALYSKLIPFTLPEPEINISSGPSDLPSGNTYDFGNVNMLSNSGAVTFTIENLGTASLTLSGTPKVVLTGADASDFTINETSTAASVAASGSTSFTITFAPSSTVQRNASISISNNDANENPYIILLKGTGVKNEQSVSGGLTIITKTYGDSDFTLGAQTTNGTTVSYSSGNTSVFTVSGNTVHIVGAGSTTITATAPGNANYNALNTTVAFTVNTKVLSVTADNKTKEQGDVNPAFTITYTGFVNGDDENDLGCLVVPNCAATVGSATGNYPIEVSDCGYTNTNYVYTFQDGVLNITTATSVSGSVESDLTVYPNPSDGSFFIDALNMQVEAVTVINSIGQSEVFEGTTNINTRFEGLLLLQIKTSKGVFLKKIQVR